MISIIIPAWNEAARIGQQLRALADQVSAADCEILVADNGSTDDTVETATSWAKTLPLTVCVEHRRGASAARNLAASLAKGDLLVFVDADDVVRPGFVDAWRGLPAAAAFGTGPVIPDSLAGSASERPGASQKGPPMLLSFMPYALGANLAVRSMVFQTMGGFNEEYAVGEDVELSWRLQLAGYELHFLPTAEVVKREPSSLGATLRKYYAYGRSDPHLYRQFRNHGVPRPDPSRILRSYAGLAGRLPLLYREDVRRRWAHQVGRRAGRLRGSVEARTWYP